MTTTFETTQETAADMAYERMLAGMEEVAWHANALRTLGVAEPGLTEVPTFGPHRLLALNETRQPSGAFKYNGAAYAMLRTPESAVVAGSAGNWAAGLAEAALRTDKRVKIFAPGNISKAKELRLRAYGVDLDLSPEDVVGALARAKEWAEIHTDTRFLHAFNDPHGVVGQTQVGTRLVKGLLRREACGEMNLASDPVEILIQAGGRSLLAAIASAVRKQKEQGRFGDNVSVREVRPELLPDKQRNPRYDGLNVDQPGEILSALVKDERFVQGTMHVNELATGRAACRMEATFGIAYEPSGLAGVAAYEQMAPRTNVPTTFVSVLSGKNVTPEDYEYFYELGARKGPLTLRGGSMVCQGTVERTYVPAPSNKRTAV